MRKPKPKPRGVKLNKDKASELFIGGIVGCLQIAHLAQARWVVETRLAFRPPSRDSSIAG
jgi:hypothetical protein